LNAEKPLPGSNSGSSEDHGRKSGRVLPFLDEPVPETADAFLVRDALRQKRAHFFALLRQTIRFLTGTHLHFHIFFHFPVRNVLFIIIIIHLSFFEFPLIFL